MRVKATLTGFIEAENGVTEEGRDVILFSLGGIEGKVDSYAVSRSDAIDMVLAILFAATEWSPFAVSVAKHIATLSDEELDKG